MGSTSERKAQGSSGSWGEGREGGKGGREADRQAGARAGGLGALVFGVCLAGSRRAAGETRLGSASTPPIHPIVAHPPSLVINLLSDSPLSYLPCLRLYMLRPLFDNLFPSRRWLVIILTIPLFSCST